MNARQRINAEIREAVRKRWRLQNDLEAWAKERELLNRKIAGAARQVRRLDDRELAKQHNVPITRVRSAGYE